MTMLSKAETKNLLTKLQAAKDANNHAEIEKLNNQIAKTVGFLKQWPPEQLQIDPNNPDTSSSMTTKADLSSRSKTLQTYNSSARGPDGKAHKQRCCRSSSPR
jgi:hypothetical protein